jgi:hypothetical protein
MAVSSSYPTGYFSYTTKADEVDDVAADHINQLQVDAIALGTAVGTVPQGSKATMTERLSVCIGTDGALAHSNAFPGSAVDGQMFYRDDEDVLYVYDGASWDAQGQSLSNVIFSFAGLFQTVSSGVTGFSYHSNLVPTSPAFNRYAFWSVESNGTAYHPIIQTRWTKIASINTITAHAYIWQNSGSGGASARFKVDIGAQSGTAVGSVNRTLPEAVTASVDVSGLNAGTTYNVQIRLGYGQSHAYMGSVIGIAS